MKRQRNKVISIVLKGVNNDKTVRQIHKDILRVTNVKPIVIYFTKLAKTLKNEKKQQLKKEDIYVPLFVKEPKKMNEVYEKTNSLIYQQAQQVEAREKIEFIETTIRLNRNLQKVFYLASSHEDCAEDHKNYQGRLYIDERYKTILDDDNVKAQVEAFVKKHNIKTFQWVVGKPVWFITRPNCRHFFKAINTDEVLTEKVSTLTRNHKMHSQVGKKETQTIYHSVNKEWYKKENVDTIIEKYKQRLSYHKAVYETFKSPTIKRAIEKDMLLIKKWVDFREKL